MLIDGKNLKNLLRAEADVCILGSGPAGITLARELKSVFSNVVILEAGDETYTQESQDFYKVNSYSNHYRDPSVSRLRFLGGTSNHWLNNTSPFSKIDFEHREWIPNSGWPISLKELQPYYLKASEYVGTKQDGYEKDYWLDYFKTEDIFQPSSQIESSFAKGAIPQTRFFEKYGKELIEAPNITIYKNANVVDIEFSAVSNNVQKIFFNSYNDLKHSIEAQYFVMCFGGIENARFMLLFNQKYKNKIGNANDNVGRYFMDHPSIKAANIYTQDKKPFAMLSQNMGDRHVGRFFQLTEKALKDNQTVNIRMPTVESSEYALSDGISSFHIMKQAFAQGNIPEKMTSHIANFLSDIDLVAEAIARKSFDSSLFESSNAFGGYEVGLMLEQTPHRDNQIRLSNIKDKLGIPTVDIRWELKEIDKKLLWRSLEVFAREVGAHSLGRVKLMKERAVRIFGDQMGFGHHHMGTTRMSHDETNGVVDKNQLVFGTENFYISGCSVFTTGSHVPPTFTIVALSIRLAEHLKRRG